MSLSIPMIHSPLGLPHVLTLAVLVFGLGLYGLLVARNRVRFLMCAQLLLGAVTLALAAFSTYLGPGSFGGQSLAMLLPFVGIAWILTDRLLEGGAS